jgi:hypothetical protein
MRNPREKSRGSLPVVRIALFLRPKPNNPTKRVEIAPIVFRKCTQLEEFIRELTEDADGPEAAVAGLCTYRAEVARRVGAAPDTDPNVDGLFCAQLE